MTRRLWSGATRLDPPWLLQPVCSNLLFVLHSQPPTPTLQSAFVSSLCDSLFAARAVLCSAGVSSDWNEILHAAHDGRAERALDSQVETTTQHAARRGTAPSESRALSAAAALLCSASTRSSPRVLQSSNSKGQGRKLKKEETIESDKPQHSPREEEQQERRSGHSNLCQSREKADRWIHDSG